MTNLIKQYGTAQPPVDRRDFAVNGLAFSLEDGALRHIKVDGKEAIRGISFLVRDRDWGTLVPEISNEKIDHKATELRISYLARYRNQGALLEVAISMVATPASLTVSADAKTTGDFETNRAGFTVLHPIDEVAGCPVRVDHSEGPATVSRFPMLIDPWQPFMDITALTHHVGHNKVE